MSKRPTSLLERLVTLKNNCKAVKILTSMRLKKHLQISQLKCHIALSHHITCLQTSPLTLLPTCACRTTVVFRFLHRTFLRLLGGEHFQTLDMFAYLVSWFNPPKSTFQPVKIDTFQFQFLYEPPLEHLEQF